MKTRQVVGVLADCDAGFRRQGRQEQPAHAAHRAELSRRAARRRLLRRRLIHHDRRHRLVPRWVPASDAAPCRLPSRLRYRAMLERLLVVAGHDESWSHLEVIDIDSDGEIDCLRIHLTNGDTMIWELGR